MPLGRKEKGPIWAEREKWAGGRGSLGRFGLRERKGIGKKKSWVERVRETENVCYFFEKIQTLSI